MNNTYDELLQGLGIPKSPDSYETYKRLKEKQEEYISRMGRQNSPEENQRLEGLLVEIGRAESYFEALAKEEKKENKSDGFDYSSLKVQKKKKKRVYIPGAAEDAAGDAIADAADDSAMTFEERYDNIIGLMGTPEGFETGFEQLKQLGEDGYVIAQRRLGLFYYHGEKCVAADKEMSIYWFEKAAMQGDAPSENQIGIMYMDGDGVEVNREAAIKWLKMAAEGGDENAAWNLGLVYAERFEEKDYREAAYWYEIAANEYGKTGAYNELGIIYMNDNGVGPNREKAIYWLKKAYEAGSKSAAWNLGLVYEDRFEEKDYKEAAYWYEIAATEYGKIEAYNELGIIYMNDNEVGPNREKAIYWLRKAHEVGDRNAAWNLGLVYEKRFAEKDYKEAAHWYGIAANENGETEAYNKLGCIYMDNIPDREKAIYWLEKAYEAGNKHVAWNLGLVYEDRFAEKDYKEAAHWYEIAANEKGETRAYHRLGIIYMDNIKDREKAIYWLKKAHEVGNKDAAWNLGLVYEMRFAEKDYKEAAHWYGIAANENGETEAYNKLGCIYMDNIPDREKAIYWLEKAYEAGNKHAAWNLGLVYEDRFAERNYDEAIKWYEKAAMENDNSKAMVAIGSIYENKKGNDALAAEWYQKAIHCGNVDAQKKFESLVAKVQTQHMTQNNQKTEEEKHGAGKFFARWKK